MRDRRKKKQNQAERMAWGEAKERFSIMLTPTAAQKIDERAKALGLSRSELLEQAARGVVSISDTEMNQEDKENLGKPSAN
ncbi:ribbon-helix-helix domain-containing protein [Allocoleopsis franciscana]|uniref:Ribbon-helix-helix protein, copG family n=1 Tax=Allocoleopsis franciscana PCC 7113 TaxID=1173027 RepID=K9WHB3_9CYAN|nr:ribbon-helix-helix domain-containing protein [Allocoleopsis franciscana]AFZ18922.1 Ribbon-helix-helix protein, copG family [Allocoleopsis franciscana PCC 7113]